MYYAWDKIVPTCSDGDVYFFPADLPFLSFKMVHVHVCKYNIQCTWKHRFQEMINFSLLKDSVSHAYTKYTVRIHVTCGQPTCTCNITNFYSWSLVMGRDSSVACMDNQVLKCWIHSAIWCLWMQLKGEGHEKKRFLKSFWNRSLDHTKHIKIFWSLLTLVSSKPWFELPLYHFFFM